MRFAISLLSALAICVSGQMSDAHEKMPTYQRQRHDARAYYSTGWAHPGPPVGPSYWGRSYGHTYSGTWYQRPYPYHFDYYRGRFNAPVADQVQPDCPCAQQQ